MSGEGHLIKDYNWRRLGVPRIPRRNDMRHAEVENEGHQ